MKQMLSERSQFQTQSIEVVPFRLDFHGTVSFAEILIFLIVGGQDGEHPLRIWKWAVDLQS